MRLGSARRVIGVACVCAMAWPAAAAADTATRGIDPNQGDSLVEIDLPSRGAAMRLQLEADRYGVEFNEHYLRRNRGGTVTVTVIGSDAELDRLEAAGYDIGATIEGPRTWRARAADRVADVRAERRADRAAAGDPVTPAPADEELVVLRVDYFENYAGRFLSVEAKNRRGRAVETPQGPVYEGPAMSLSWNRGGSTPIDAEPTPMDVNLDPDTMPDTYIEHRELVRIGDPSTGNPPRPTRVRIGSSSGATIEAPVTTWLRGGLPPLADEYLKDFTTHYMDPTEVYQRLDALAGEFPNIAQLVRLPHRTNGYQRRAQATMNGVFTSGGVATPDPGGTPPAGAQDQSVVLTSRAWGHEGGNDVAAEFVNPGIANAGLTVTTVGTTITVSLATDAAGAPASTAAQVAEAINANEPASRLVKALTYRGNAGAGIVQPRARVNLSDFLTARAANGTVTNAHVKRGPFEYSVLRIGKRRDGSRVGVFLYCQQHAREWATPLTCLETAEQLLRNYAIDRRIRRLVDQLDIFILPSSNPDGGHYSMHNFNLQRRNLTNHCVVGGKAEDDPFSPAFWTPRTNPQTGAPYTNSDPASRNSWGVDLNRNNTFATLFDGYIGASHSCTSDIYTGPAEASEPEIRNELWIADTFKNIKFSNNIHSFGGYFMWSPGSYLPNRDEGEAVHPNIGVEKYFFAAGERILNRIKEVRNTVILPERTGPIADVLYSAAGNSADEHWYNRDVIAYSFETGADRFVPTSVTAAATAGQPGIRVANRSGIDIGDRLVIGRGTPNEETRTVAQVPAPNPAPPAANVIFTEPLANAHAAGESVIGPTIQQAVGFQPDYATEGKFEALEFAAGNIGLLESAFAYQRDDDPPEVRMTGPARSSTPIRTTFEFVDEPAVIHYTTDGSSPTEDSPVWDSTGPREPGQTFVVTETTRFRWLARDIKGNVSRGQQRFVIAPPT